MQQCTLAIVGDGSVGKSTVTSAFKSEGFVSVYKQTIGCDFYERQLQIRKDHFVSLRVWDIGGQSIQSKNFQQYVSHSNAVLVVYDVTNRDSFANLDDWLRNVRKFCTTDQIYLAGNKVDLISLRQISEMEHRKFIDDNRLKGGIFCSAKTGENVVKMFYKIAGEAIGVKLTDYELGFYDKVLTAHVEKSNDKNEIRNEYADEIEREDMEAERRKEQKSECMCICS